MKAITLNLFCTTLFAFTCLIFTGLFSADVLASKYDHQDRYDVCTSTQSNSSTCDSALGESVYNMLDEGINVSTNPLYSNISVDGVSISVSAWSDTVGTYNDDVVTSAYVSDLGHYGYGVYNKDDEIRGSSPDHAIDSVNTVYYNVDHDFDFILLSFSESVSLSGAAFTWVGDMTDTQVSIAGLDDISGLTSNTQTWSNIVEDALTAGSYNITNTNSIDVAQFEQNASSQYWLIGAYNAVFGQLNADMFDDAFKLASIGFSKAMPSNDPPSSTEVSEPHSIGILLAAGLIYCRQRKQRINLSNDKSL